MKVFDEEGLMFATLTEAKKAKYDYAQHCARQNKELEAFYFDSLLKEGFSIEESADIIFAV